MLWEKDVAAVVGADKNSFPRGYQYDIVVICLLAMLCFTACSSDLPAIQQIQEDGQNTAQTPIEIVISHSQNVGTPVDCAARAMQKKLQTLLGDTAEVILYADYQRGSAREQLEAVQLGRMHITIQSVSVVSGFVDDMKVFALPYLFSSNQEDVMAVLDGPLAQEALDRISMEQGEPAFKGLGLWFGGYHFFTFSGQDNRYIHSPSDFQGQTIAIADAPLLKALYQHWGAEPVVTDDIALYSMLAGSAADGSEATASQIVSQYLYEVQRNVVRAYHSAEIDTVLVNARWFASLPAEVQDAVLQAEDCGKEALYQALAEQEPAYIDIIRHAAGMHYTELSEKEMAVFRASVQPLYQEQLSGSTWQMDYVKRLQKCFT